MASGAFSGISTGMGGSTSTMGGCWLLGRFGGRLGGAWGAGVEGGLPLPVGRLRRFWLPAKIVQLQILKKQKFIVPLINFCFYRSSVNLVINKDIVAGHDFKDKSKLSISILRFSLHETFSSNYCFTCYQHYCLRTLKHTLQYQYHIIYVE